MLQYIAPVAYGSMKLSVVHFHHLSSYVYSLKPSNHLPQLTFIVTNQCVWNIKKKAWSHLLIMPLLRLQRLQKFPKYYGTVWDLFMIMIRGKNKTAVLCKVVEMASFHGKRYSTLDFTRRIMETFNTERIIQCILKIQVSRSGEMLTFCYMTD